MKLSGACLWMFHVYGVVTQSSHAKAIYIVKCYLDKTCQFRLVFSLSTYPQ